MKRRSVTPRARTASTSGSTPDDILDPGTEPANETGVSLETKYASQMRQIFPTRLDLPLLTLKIQIDQQINLKPEFQRRQRWNKERRSRLIESIIMNVPIPPVFLGEEEYGKFVVLDGRQRLTAAYDFLTDRLRLEGLEVWAELNGKTYSDLKASGLAATIERRVLPAILLTRESSPEVKYEVFERLNTGGVVAKPMEVRNAIYHGLFNKQLHGLSALPVFRDLWGIPDSTDPAILEENGIYAEMADLELVLRFFALQGATLAGERFKDRLSTYMKERNEAYAKDFSLAARDASLFERAVSNAFQVFGQDAFRKPIDDGRRSAPYADAILYALSYVDLEVASDTILQRIKRALQDLYRTDTAYQAAILTGTNGESAIHTRLSKARSAVQAVGSRAIS